MNSDGDVKSSKSFSVSLALLSKMNELANKRNMNLNRVCEQAFQLYIEHCEKKAS